MIATPVLQADFHLRVPSFLVVRGIVHWSLGGTQGILKPCETLSYRKHGAYMVEYAGDSYAIIHHTTVLGLVRKVFIPSQKRLYLSNGRFELGDVNYQSFVNHYSKSAS